MQINSKFFFFFGFTILASIVFFSSIEPGRSIKTWGVSLWLAAVFIQLVIWGYFFFKNSNILLSLLLLNLYIVLVINFISTPFISSIQSYFSLPKNMKSISYINDESMHGFEIGKKIIIETDNMGFRTSKAVSYSDEMEKNSNNRIVIIGSSQVEEIYLNFDETWGYNLGKNFKQEFEVINTGVSGLTVKQLKKNLEYLIKKNLKSKYYIFLFGQTDWNNHILESNLNFKDKMFMKFSFRKSFLMKIYTLLKFEISPRSDLKSAQIIRYGKSQSDSLNNRRKISNKLKKIPTDYIKEVAKIIDLCKVNSLNCIFLESPNAYNLEVSKILKKNFWQTPPNTDYSLKLEDLVTISELYNNWLKEFVEINSFLFCKVNKFLEPTEKIFYDDSHLNPYGSKKISEILYKCIEKF